MIFNQPHPVPLPPVTLQRLPDRFFSQYRINLIASFLLMGWLGLAFAILYPSASEFQVSNKPCASQ